MRLWGPCKGVSVFWMRKECEPLGPNMQAVTSNLAYGPPLGLISQVFSSYVILCFVAWTYWHASKKQNTVETMACHLKLCYMKIVAFMFSLLSQSLSKEIDCHVWSYPVGRAMWAKNWVLRPTASEDLRPNKSCINEFGRRYLPS